MSHNPPLSRQQRFFNFWARYAQRPTLQYVKSPRLLRFLTDLTAPLTYKRPADMLRHAVPVKTAQHVIPATACTIKHQAVTGTLLYLHGGGFVIGSLPMYQHLVARLGAAAGLRGVFVDYRMAPEHPFPAAVDDALATYTQLCADPSAGPIAIAGDSAGGNLVLALLLKLKACGLPPPFAAVALSPVVNLESPYPAFHENVATDPLLPPEWGLRCLASYIGDHDRRDPLLSPIFGDFTGAPPCMVHYDTAELLSDDGRIIVQHLADHGVAVETEITTGRTHVWHLNVGRVPEADASVAVIGDFLRRHHPG